MDYLIGCLTGARILLLLLYRPEYTHSWGSKSFYNRIGLEQLTAKSSAELIRSILQVGEAAPELEELILDRAAGNPLFMEEFYEMLAHHYSRSDNFNKANYFLKLSGDKVMRKHSVLEAFCYYKDAMSALKRLPESEENTRKQLAIIHSMLIPIIVLGFPKESLSILQAGGRIATTIDDKKSLIRFYSNMGLYYTHEGRQTEGRQTEGRKYSGKAFEEAEKIQDIESMAQAGPDIVGSYFMEGNYKKAIDLASRVTNQIEKNQMQAETFGGPANVYPALKAFCGCSMGMLGDFERALTLCERAVEDAVSFGNIATKCMSEHFYGMVLMNRGEWETAKAHLKNCIKHYAGKSLIWLGRMTGIADSHKKNEALEYIQRGLKILRALQTKPDISIACLFLGEIYWSLGPVDKASNFLKKAAEMFEEMGMDYWLDKTQEILEQL